MSIDGLINCDALCDLVPFIQFQKREKHRWGILLVKLKDLTKSDTRP